MAVRPLYSSSLVWVVGIFGIFLSLAVAAATFAALWVGRGEAIAAAESTTRSLVRTVTDAVARSVNSIDVTLSSVADLAKESGLGKPELDLGAPVRQRLLFTPHLRQILVVAADGRILFDSAGPAKGRRLDVAPLLEEHTRIPRPLLIGVPVEGRFIGSGGRGSGLTLIPVSRPIMDAKGDIAALVIAAINPDHFIIGFDDIEAESHAHVALWRFDGIPLVEGGRPRARSAVSGSTPAFVNQLKVSEMGTFTGSDNYGVVRITSYRTTLSWPLVVSVGIPTEAALAGWWRNVEYVGWPVAVVTLVVLGLTAMLVRSLARRARDEARLRLSDRVLNSISNGVTIADAHHGDLPLVYVNPAFEQITGYTAEEVLGRNARFLHTDLADQDGLDTVRAALAEGEYAKVVLQNARADGSIFWNELSLAPVTGPSGEITHWVGVQRDISVEEEARVALANAYHDVARYSTDLERFSFVLAHHLQEPARQMRLQAQVLLQQTGNFSEHGGRGAAELIVEASARLIDLLRDVQTYLSIERHPSEGGVGASDPAFAAAIARFGVSLPEGALVVEKGELPRVGLGQKRLDDLFEILVENAIAFRHPDRPLHLQVSAERVDDTWRFQLADNGIGIEKPYFERIFVALERLHARTTHGGNGIGLAVARKIVESAEGRIWVESDGASGSTFFFTLPTVRRG
ncbi:Signal transduction histidine kinase [Candidatus Terasakiella magnetica]|nr:Signal transduction histidine kinase [Candidatus Terasakiella magnetica]